LHVLTGSVLFLAICAPWFVLVSLRNPEFAWFFFVHEHFLRYTTTIHRRVEPWYYFIPLFIAGALPWLLVMMDAAWRSWSAEARASFQVKRFLLIWCVFVFAFFSVSGSKLPSYILPLFPALALLTGWRLSRISGTSLAWQMAPMLLLGAAALIALPFAHSSGDTPVALINNYKPWLAAAALVGLAATLVCIRLARQNRIGPAVAVAGFGGLIAIQLAITGHEALSPSMSAAATQTWSFSVRFQASATSTPTRARDTPSSVACRSAPKSRRRGRLVTTSTAAASTRAANICWRRSRSRPRRSRASRPASACGWSPHRNARPSTFSNGCAPTVMAPR
jgi:4-amino-4-deoxy-L-arabinose transferase-like glycosyltransferase